MGQIQTCVVLLWAQFVVGDFWWVRRRGVQTGLTESDSPIASHTVFIQTHSLYTMACDAWHINLWVNVYCKAVLNELNARAEQYICVQWPLLLSNFSSPWQLHTSQLNTEILDVKLNCYPLMFRNLALLLDYKKFAVQSAIMSRWAQSGTLDSSVWCGWYYKKHPNKEKQKWFSNCVPTTKQEKPRIIKLLLDGPDVLAGDRKDSPLTTP